MTYSLVTLHSYSHLGGGEALCRDDRIPTIAKTTRIIFDCDGVIVSDRDSYRQAIIRSVDHYFLRLMGLIGEEGRLVTQDDIQNMKNTGAFNNDWNLTYALLTYFLGLILRRLPSEAVLDMASKVPDVKRPEHIHILSERLKTLGERALRLGIDVENLAFLKSDRRFGLAGLTSILAKKTEPSFLKEIGKFLELDDSVLHTIKRFCPFSLKEEDLLRRLFDEIYLGERLYSQFTGKESFFVFSDGLIDKEERIPSEETMERLRLRFGSFAMYSERPKREGYYTLSRQGLLRYFDEEAILFIGDIMKSPVGTVSNLGLGKPDAGAFVNLLKRFSREDDTVAYVGDTVSDAMMIMNARRLDTRELILIGTLSSSPNPADLKREFVKIGAEVIVKDVNAIPLVFDKIGK
ncbi:hypothetical protein KEJ39_06815 [Candidatus Bathyarchaeota archaeon]|nr:hypothetical protein [Candidatus Bathyarchaeota archaeon]